MVQKSQRLASITFLKGTQAGKIFHITKPITTIGRDRSNDIVLTDLKVSRQHARLVWDNGTWSIVRLPQSSTVTVNQHDVEQNAAIQHNSSVELGEDSAFLFLIPPDDEQLPPPTVHPVQGIPTAPAILLKMKMLETL
ncbi:MAG: FHA domain-containing protein [Ktedonobacteraceae bacterium]